jgi:hypothetical protein
MIIISIFVKKVIFFYLIYRELYLFVLVSLMEEIMLDLLLSFLFE